MKLLVTKEINSESTYNKKYNVRCFLDEFGYQIWVCNCPAYLFGHSKECKHIQAVKEMPDIVEKLGKNLIKI